MSVHMEIVNVFRACYILHQLLIHDIVFASDLCLACLEVDLIKCSDRLKLLLQIGE